MADLITVKDPRSPASEAYRTLRTNLMFQGLESQLKTLVVTSPAPEDGKSTALANLAVTLAQGGQQVILADCDLRRPSQHAIWGIDREPGLTTMILEGLEVPPLAAPGIEGLTVLPSGPLPPNPADLVGSPRMESIINKLTERADYVLFDAPPVIAVTDAALLASRLDGVLLVLRAGGTRRDHAERARELLERIGVRIVGAVLLDAEVDGRVGGYYGE